MADKIPSLLPLNDSNRFAAPDYETQSKLPSPLSPTRHTRFAIEELDPLLSNLSPVSTLEALRTNDAVAYLPGSKEKILAESIAEASENERALGVRAALAGKKIRDWVDEVQAWKWPDAKFEPPRKLAVTDDAGNQNAQVMLDKSTQVYWGSLPARIVQELEDRIDIIRDSIDTLEVEDLKNYVRGAHSQATSRSSSFSYHDTFAMPATQYTRMADFTVIITATIVQSLPILARLERLLNLWSLRCHVLRMVPGFLQQLEDVQVALDSAWSTISQATNQNALGLSRETYRAIKDVLEDRVLELARQIDAILDALEGHDDRIPDQWIDDMEYSQQDFENWIIEAQRLVQLHEWHAQKSAEQQEQNGQKAGTETSADETTDATSVVQDGNQNETIDVPENVDSTAVRKSSANGDLEATNSLLSMTPVRKDDTTVAQQETKAEPSKGNSRSVESGAVLSPRRGLFFMRDASLGTIPASPTTSSHKNISSNPELEMNGSAEVAPNSPAIKHIIVDNLNEQSVNNSANEAKDHPIPSDSNSTDNSSVLRRSSSRKPPPLQLAGKSERIEPPPSSEASYGTSASSSAFSDMSSPQIMDAASVQFFKSPAEDSFPVYITKDTEDIPLWQTNQRTQTPGRSGHGRSISAYEPIARSRAGSHLSDVTVVGREVEKEPRDEQDELVHPAISAIKRASIASFESVPRSELRNIDIKRHSSFIPRDHEIMGETPEKSVAEQMSEAQKELEAEQSGTPSKGDASPSLRVRKTRLEPVSDITDLDGSNVDGSQSLQDQQQKPSEDKMTAKISRILTRIPAPIRLAITPPHGESAESGGKAGATKHLETPANRMQRSTTPSLTLSPATKTRNASSQHGDSEVRVYHLHQPGKEQPIKLFIRLVGTEERVMVRVGGGWADLAEYLKDYAIHHGHRSVSGGSKLEIKNLPGQSSATTTGAPHLHEGGRSPSNSVSAGTPGSKSGGTPQSRRDSVGASASSPYTPESTAGKQVDTPPSLGNPHDSALLGLAGPKSKKNELSPTKKAWVDGMINQARTISFEKKKDGKGPDSGAGEGSETRKVSGIRRVFMRGKGDEP